MRHIHRKHHWIGRFLAADPGLKRFQQAGKATISMITSVLTMLLLLRLTGNPLITPAIVSGMAGMMSIMIVMDETKKKKQVTTVLLGVSASIGITAGSMLSGNAYYVDILMVAIIFSSFYFARFNVRYFSLCMIGFFTVYFSSVLRLSAEQLPWFYVGITIGIAFGFIYNFILFKDSAHVLRRSMRSFHIQINLTFDLLTQVIEDPSRNDKRQRVLENNVRKVGEYARIVGDDLKAQDVNEIWPGLETAQLRLYVFDTEMLVETLTDSIKRLKLAEAFETAEIRRLLVRVVRSLRDAEVLDQENDYKDLVEAEKSLQSLRLLLADFMNRDERPSGWLYLIRRIESIANHVIEAAHDIQQSLKLGNRITEETDGEDSEDDNDDKKDEDKSEPGLKPSTKKAFQGLAAGVVSIIVGQIISPTQPYWVLLTAFIVLLGTESIGRTYTKGFQRSLGTVIGAILGFGMAKLVSGHSTVEIVLLFLVIFLAFYLFAVSYTLMSMFITMLIAFMYDILLGGISLSLLGARVLDTIAGAAIALGISVVVFPKKTKDKVADAFDEFLSELKPYVTDYVRGFREDVDVKGLADRAFTLDQKLQMIKDEAHTLLQRREAISPSEFDRWITIFTAINYFARHLVASSYRKNFEYPDEIIDVFIRVEEILGENIDTLMELVRNETRKPSVFSLQNERELIERLAPSRKQSHRDLIHHLYYVWRINQSVVRMAIDLGAEEK